MTTRATDSTYQHFSLGLDMALNSPYTGSSLGAALTPAGQQAQLATQQKQQQTVEQTLAERGNRYGDFTDHAAICQSLKRVMTCQEGWGGLTDVQRQALDVIADKIARILSGDPNYADNWHDIQGYAKLVEDRLPPQS